MKNIIYMHTHDSGRYFSPYGYAVPTPNIQSLAQESLLFRNAYCAGPTCSPSRVGLLSGMAPHSAGMLGLAHRGFRMNDYNQHLVSFLRSHGYFTALAGIQHESRDVSLLRYEKVFGKDDWLRGEDNDEHLGEDGLNAEAAARFILQWNGDRPFFLSFGMFSTHRPYPRHGDDINPDYVIPPFPIADNAANREDMADFMRSAQIADTCVGKVLRALRQSGHERDTILIFTTDHGISMPFMKCNLYDTGIGVSLMIRTPDLRRAGQATDALVSQIDLFPSICQWLHLPAPAWLQGVSLLPLFDDPASVIRQDIFSEVTYHAAYEPARCIRTRDYKLIRYYDVHNRYVPANIDAGAPKTFLLESGLLSRTRPREMLFDLRLDPMERVNLAGDAAYMPVYEDLSLRLEEWMLRTQDPLIHTLHRVEPPAGAMVNRLDALEPNDYDFE